MTDLLLAQPHNDDAERQVVGAAMLDQRALQEISAILDPADLYDQRLSVIYQAALDLHAQGAPVDTITVEDRLTKSNQLNRVGGGAELLRLISGVVTAAGAVGHAQIVADHAVRRRLITAGQRVADAAARPGSDLEEVLAHARAAIEAAAADKDAAVEAELAHNREVNEQARRLRTQRDARALMRREELADVEIPQPMRLDVFLARKLNPVTHRIAGLMPVGARVLLAAQWKAGKTTLRDNLVRSLVDGDPFLGHFHVSPLPAGAAVVILDFELDGETLQRWLMDHQIENQDRVHVLPLRGSAATFDIRDEELRARWAKNLRDVGAGVLVLDCLRPVLDALGLDENHEAGLFLVAFDALLAEAGIREALVIHHMGHTSERARGDSRLRDWPDAEWRLLRDKDEEDDTIDDPAGARYFSAYGRDVNHPQTELAFDPTTRHLSLSAAGGTRKDAVHRRKLDKAIAAVRTAVGADPGLNKTALRRATAALGSGHNPDVDAAVELMVQDGRLLRQMVGQMHLHYLGTEPATPTVPTVPNRAPDTVGTTVSRALIGGTVHGVPHEHTSGTAQPGHGHTCPHGVPDGDQPSDFLGGRLTCPQCRLQGMTA